MSQAYKPNQSPEEAVGKDRAAHIFKMSANENPLGPSPKAMKAMVEAIPTLGRYPPKSDISLREKLAAVHGRGLSPDNFIVGNSGCDILRLSALANLNEHSSILQCPPAFPLYHRTATQQGALVIDVPLDKDSFSYQLEVIKAALRPDTKAIYVCNPNNPTGTTFGQDVFDELLELLPENALLVYDEVYYQFVKGIEMPDAVAAVLAGKNVLIIHSFSKSYGLAGLRAGYGIAPEHIIKTMEAKKNPFHVGALTLKAAEAALTDTEHVQKTVDNNTKGRIYISSSLQTLGIKVWPSEANFVLFEVPEGFSAEGLTQRLQDHNLMVRPAFGLDNHLRVSVALPEANEAFITAMKAILTS